MVTLLVVVTFSCFDIDEEFCNWEILTAEHFNELTLPGETGERYLIGLIGDSRLTQPTGSSSWSTSNRS